MFTAIAQKNLADAESYFGEHLAQNAYYAAGEIRPGQWIGIGTERLGPKNAVTREQFCALCESQSPQSGERLTQRQLEKGKRRVFYDSSARLAAIEATPALPRSDCLQTILQRGNQFLKRFRQRVAQAILTERSIHEIKRIEPQRQYVRVWPAR